MNDQEAERLRNAIMRHQTACRCGHLLAACADCRDWLSQHSVRIAASWQRRIYGWGSPAAELWPRLESVRHANAAEADDRAHYFKSLR